MDVIFEAVLRPVLGVIWYLLWDIIFLVLLFNIGRVLLLIITLGRYPRGDNLQKHRERISIVGFIFVIFIWTTIAPYNNFVSIIE